MPYVKTNQRFSRPYPEEQVCPVCFTNLGETVDAVCSEACEEIAKIRIEWVEDYV